MPGATETIFFLVRARPFLWPLLSLFCWFDGCLSTLAAQLHVMPPPLSVTCAKPENRVYQQQDHAFQVSCLWDRYVVLHYTKAPQRNPKEGGTESPMPPLCHWYRDAILVNQTTSWTGELMLVPSLPQESPHPPWASTRISVQCISVSCLSPLCLYHNLSIEVVGQDIRLFLLQPHTLPILERQPVRLGWCARLKSSAWHYYFESQGGLPEALLIPTNQHDEPLLLSDYPSVELNQVCTSYYSYHLTVQYPFRGSYIASVSYKPGPQSSLSLDFFVEPALLFVFRVTSQLQRPSQGALSFSWHLQQLSPEIVAYQLLETQGSLEWSHSYEYNLFGLHSRFCAVPTSHPTKETVVASVYFRTSQRISERVRGRLDFSNRTLIFRTSRTSSISIRLNPQENTISTYIFSRAQGLYYSTQKGNLVNKSLAGNSSLCYVLYQQAGLSYLITVKFVQLQLFRFSLDIYLNRKEALFKSLGGNEMDVYVFNSTSPDNSLVYVVWFIPVQHPLLQCEWAFNLQVFDSVGGRLVENYSFAYIDQTRNAAHFLPDSALAFHPASYAGFVARVKCVKSAKIPIVFTTSFNIYVLKVIESQIACQQKTCTIPKVRIHRAVNTKHILHYAQGTGFTLAADMRVNCPGPKATKVSWNIYKVSNLSDRPDWSKPFNPPGIEGRHFIRLKIPCSILDTGLYLFNFTVQLISSTFSQKIERSDAVLIEVGSDRWGAVITGGHFRSVGFSDRWILKGSVLSNGELVSLPQGLSYTWYCTKQETDYTSMALSGVGKCYPDQVDLKWTASSDSIQMVLPETLQANNTYHFLLLVQNGSRITQAQQTIHVQAHGALILNIACIENCGTSVIPTERFSLSGKCGNCREIKSWYYWSLRSAQSHEIKFDWSSRTTTGRASSYLHFKAFALISMAEESYILSLKAITKDGQSSSCEYSFYVNGPPQIGKCALNPGKGVAFLTKFIIQCSGFEDRNQPLAYKVIAASDQMTASSISSIQNNTLGIIIYAGNESKTPWSFLPPGRPSEHFALTIYVQVFDTLGAFSQVTLQATVLDHRQPKTNAVLHQQLHDLINRSSALTTRLLITKDYRSIGYIVYMVASALNNIEASPSNWVPKADLRQHLLNITTRIPSTSIREITQAILSVCQVTHEIAEVGKVSQLLGVRKLKTVSEALRRHRDEGLGSKETEILSNGILTGLSNIWEASLLNHRNPNADAIKETISVTEILADLILQGKVPGGHETKMAARNWTIHLWKDKTWDVSGTFSNRKQCRSCFYPKLKQGSHAELEDNVISTILYEFEQNPFPWLGFADNIGTMVTGFKMVGIDSKGDLTTIVPDVFEMILTRKDKAIFELTIGPDKKLPKTTGGFSLEIKRNSSDIFIQLVPQMKITFQVFIYLGVNLSHPPLISYNASRLSPPKVIQNDTIITGCALKVPYVLCLPKSLLWSPAYNRGAHTLNLSIVLQSHSIVRHQSAKSLHVAIFAAGCLALEGVQDQWKEETCSLGPQTSWSKIHCVCKAKKHSTKSTRSGSRGASGPGIRFLAGKLLLFPNQVDMKTLLLQPTGENPVPGLIVLAVLLIYISLAMWVRRKDRIDIEEQIIDLPDNDPFHTMRYLVTIYTGSRPSAGTKADVFIELIGQNGSSDVHLLKHPLFPEILQNSCTDTFMLTTKDDLGDLLSIHIWHNYCGFGPNWYLSRIKVLNVDTNTSWLFLCRKWLALGRNNYQIEWTFEVTDPQVPISRIDYMLIMFSYHWFQDHLWFSIFVRSLNSSWNRFQRLSCCLAILLTSLLVNTIIFNTKKEEHIYLIELQFVRSIIAGVLSAVISSPVGWIAVSLFKYSMKESSPFNIVYGQRKKSNTGVPESLPIAGTQLSEITSQRFSATDNNFSNNYASEKKATLGETEELQWRRCLSCSAWFFVFLVCGVASFSITFLGLSFDHKTSSEWLLAALISFCLHVSVFETLQIVIFSSWNICLAKYCADIPWQTYEDMKYTPRRMKADEMVKLHENLVELRVSKKYQPIKEEDVTALQKNKMIQYLAYKYIKDMICHFIFLALIFTISHPIDVTTAFFYDRAMTRKFYPHLPNLNEAQDVYRWVNNSFLPLIHNPYHPGYIQNTWSKILGLPRMRQIRKKSADRCLLPYELKDIFLLHDVQCKNNYGFSEEDQTNYVGSWSSPTDTSVPQNRAEFLGFSYEPSSSQWEYISYGSLNEYPSSGYTFYFFPEEPQVNSTKRLEALEMKSWIDNKTWAVIFELTTFNVDANMFCSVSVIFELSLLGPVNASIFVHSYKLPFFTHQSMSQIFFFSLTIYILIIYIVDECRMMYREQLSYFTLATNLINFGIKTVCVIFLVVLLCKFKLSSDLVHFYLLHSQEFIPFHTASQFDQTVKGVLGILVFFLVLKTYRYARFLFDIRLAQKSLRTALPGIINIVIMGAIFFNAYTSLGYVGFGQHEWNFRTMMYSFTTVLSYCALTFKNTEFLSDKLLGGLFLGSFLLVMICVFVNLSQVIIMSAHLDMKEIVYNEPSNEAEVMYFLLQKVYRMWYFANTGANTKLETKIFNTMLYGKFKKRGKRPLRKHLARKERLYIVI